MPSKGPTTAGPCIGLRRLGSIRSQSTDTDKCLDIQGAMPQLLRLLDPSASTKGWRMRPVGVNNAAWLLEHEHREGWMVKCSGVRRPGSNLPTGLENCDRLVQKFPGILQDPHLAFPHSVVDVRAPVGRRRLSELLISRRCDGVQLGKFMADLDLSQAQDQERLEQVCASVGELLANFHKRYSDPSSEEPTYHTDFHPGNVLYDAKVDTLTIIDPEGMGCGGITDDADKFDMLISRLAGRRYGAAFRQRYMKLAPEEALQIKADRSCSKSTAASSLESLYASIPSLPAQNFEYRSTLAVPDSGFDPQRSLVTLTWLVCPSEKLTQPVLTPIPRRKAWLLHQSGRKEGFYLQQVAEDVYAAGGMSIERKCEDFIDEFPEVLKDDHVAFPDSVIPLQGKTGSSGQVFVAKCACITTLEQHVTEWRQKQKDEGELRAVFRQVGTQLSQSLSRYTTPHTPHLRPSCVLYEASTGLIAFADFAWPGDAKNAVSAVDRLSKSLKLFADQGLVEEFCEGYSRTQRTRRRSSWSCWSSLGPGGTLAPPCDVHEESSDEETELLLESDVEQPQSTCFTM